VGVAGGIKADWRGNAKYLTYTGLAASMGHVPELFARAVVGCVTRVMSWRESAALTMNQEHMRRMLAFECEEGVVPDPALVRRWSRRSFVEYGHYWIDGARLPYTGADEIRARWILSPGSEQNLHAAQVQGRPMIMALPHVGTWEWGGAWLALEGMPMTAVVERLEPERLFDWFADQRRQMGLTAVALGEGSSAAVLKALRANALVGLVSDRDLAGNGVEVDFFGERTTLPGGAATLALRTGAILLPVTVYSGPDSWHTGVVHRPLDATRRGSFRADVQRLTQELATVFEHDILAHPEQWHLYQPNWPSDRDDRADRDDRDDRDDRQATA
jgi:phosphatidylinositol dimannoside acyltransferase